MSLKILDALNHKTILILGLAREGLSSYSFISQHCPKAKFIFSDKKALADLKPTWQKLISKSNSIEFIQVSEVKNKKFDLVIKTPGIPLGELTKHQIDTTKLTSNTQLLFDLVNQAKSKPLIIGITGTKGKTTTTAVIHHILKSAGKNALLGGNIGTPPLNLVSSLDLLNSNTIFVLEISSHQLAELKSSPSIAVIQDIVPDHLDYYPDFETYYQSKQQITRFQSSQQLTIFNQDSATATKLANISKAKKIPFSLKNEQLVKFIKKSNPTLVGKHNYYNMMPAVIISRELGLSDNQISHGLATFKPVIHRLEFIKKVKGVDYYNDSAANSPEAAIAALKTFAEENIVLITGGKDKGLDNTQLAKQILSSKIRFLILFPDTGHDILNKLKEGNQLNQVPPHQLAFSMEEAVSLAKKHALSGDIVLLSPATSSFNMFQSYTHRGKLFTQHVINLS